MARQLEPKMSIRPLPTNFGVGFVSKEKLDTPLWAGYRYEQKGRYHNYHVTPQAWQWPVEYLYEQNYVIDAFSPNLNKNLHVGHLRQLVLATSLSRFMPKARFVALLGASLGVLPGAYEQLQEWFNFAGYHPQEFQDIDFASDDVSDRLASDEEMVADYDSQTFRLTRHNPGFGPGSRYKEGDSKPWVWEGPMGPVITRTSEGKKLYAHHDLAFAKRIGPTHYITDHGQAEHFINLGFKDKFLPMGLVLGPQRLWMAKDSKVVGWEKMRSRSGDAKLAEEIVEEVIERLEKTPWPRKLAWNVLAWNFLQRERSKDVKFQVEEWTKPDQPGLYITYTLARVNKALEGIPVDHEWLRDLEDGDVELLGHAAQHSFYLNEAIQKIDPAPLAHFAMDLARRLGNVYHKERIRGGRPAFCASVRYANTILFQTMEWLGMFPLETV
jgi:arginyl-tRNA synthetase